MIDIFYLDYSKDNFQLQIGDIFQSYGSGLSMHSFEDICIHYNNSPRGGAITYYLNDNIDIFAIIWIHCFIFQIPFVSMLINTCIYYN